MKKPILQFICTALIAVLISSNCFAAANTQGVSYTQERSQIISNAIKNHSSNTAAPNKSSGQQRLESASLEKSSTERYIVKYKSENTEIKKSQSLAGVNYKRIGSGKKNLYEVSGKDVVSDIKKNGMDNIEYIERDSIKKSHGVPNDTYFSEQWNLSRMKMESAWQISTGSSSVIVAVIDSGVTPNHPDLQGVLLNGYNFLDNDYSQYDSTGHGTMNAGIIAAKGNNGRGIAGINWNLKILPLHVFDSNGEGYLSDVIDALYFAADSGANVINLSFGSTEYSQAEDEAIQYAISKGAIVVASSGNDGSSDYSYPASYNGVISVGATNTSDTKSDYSQYNDKVDVVAPGDDILSTYETSYGVGSGTSFAAAEVSGVAALLCAITPNDNLVEGILKESCVDKGAEGRDNLYGYGLINAYEAAKRTLPGKGDLNQPTSGQTISGNSKIQGWFLDGSGIAKIEVLIDGNVNGTATIGVARPDVLAAYPTYSDANSGYEYMLDTTKLTNGNHQIVIRATSSKNKQTSLAARTVVVFNIDPFAAKGDLNDPSSGQTISGSSKIRGWFLDGNGISKIEVLVDGKVNGAATTGLSRPDVLAAFPAYADGSSGYEYMLDTTKLTNGSHQIIIQETSNKNVATSLAARTIIVSNLAALPAKGDLNDPVSGQTVSGNSKIRGWFLDGNGVAKVEVLIDGKISGTATQGLARPDVLAAFPTYSDGNSGYEYMLDTMKLTNGNHQLIIRETSNKNVQTSLASRTITVSNAGTVVLPAKGDLNEPVNGQMISGSSKIRGWFMDGNGVAKIEVLIDGKVNGTAVKGLQRPDVLAAFPAYADGNSGYEYMLDTRKLTNGNHQLVIRETSNKNVQTSLAARTVKVSNAGTIVLPAKGDLNDPASGQTVSESVKVRGWFLDGNGIAKIEVLIDGKVSGTATKGLSRPDVLAAYPSYADANSGYEYMLDTTKLANGSHQLFIRETSSKNVQTNLAARTIKVSNTAVLPAKGDLNEPVNGQTLSGNTTVRGWFLDGSKVAKIEILVDGAVVGSTTTGIARSDVYAAYPAYADNNSGYEYILNSTILTNGAHTIVIRETSTGNKQTSLAARIVVIAN